MASQTLERLLFLQGNLCFFCQKPLARHEASVEHLLPSSKNGTNEEENCVACCKKLNALFGHISLKEKIRAILNQPHPFKCPAELSATEGGRARPARVEHVDSAPTLPTTSPSQTTAPTTASLTVETIAQRILENLVTRKSSRPKTLKTLTSTASALYKKQLPPAEILAAIHLLQANRKLTITGIKVDYATDLGF